MEGPTSSNLPDADVQLLQEAAQGYQRLREQIGRVIVGQQQIVRLLLAAVFCEGHVVIVGVPGLAKTLLVRTLARALGGTFKRIQFTPDMMPADITGMEILHEEAEGSGRRWHFTPGPVFANMVLADEVNRTPPKTQSALLEAMQEYTVTSMGRSYPIERPFIVVATQNPIEQEGTYPLPEAQLDRFMFSLWVDYPSREEEEQIVARTTGPGDRAVEPIYERRRLVAFQKLVRRMPVSRHVVRYAVDLARSTRPGEADAPEYIRRYVEWGAGPRAAQYLVLGAKALAVLDGRPAANTDHVRQVASSVLRHRVLVNFQASGEGIDSASLIERLLREVQEPAYEGA